MNKKNRLTHINMLFTRTGIALNANQTLCLVRNLPLIFGDPVPEGDRHWHLFYFCCISLTLYFP